MAYIGKQPTVGNFVKLDAITTSATTTFNLTNGGVAYSPQSPNHCIVSLNGVIQSPTSAYTISGSTIVFSDALTSSDTIDFILVLGDVLNIGTPSDGTITSAKLASGVSGLISWQSVQTTGFTAVAGRGYPCNTTSAAFTVTLPASPSAGDTIVLVDYAGTFATNNITINPNGNKLEGGTLNKLLTTNKESVFLTYTDTTRGWLATSGVNNGADALEAITYTASYLIVAGGGGAGGSFAAGGNSGGGGAGGYLTGTTTLQGGTQYTITVGAGGAGGLGNTVGSSGSNSSITGLTAAIGGGGSGTYTTLATSGGSGGGGGNGDPSPTYTNGGSGTVGQGNNGGNGSIYTGGNGAAGGGGGAGAVGGNASGNIGGTGGNGTASSITGSSITYAGGGGGGNGASNSGSTSGGTGGGGNSAYQTTGGNGTTNLGGGGGGVTNGNNGNSYTGGSGGSGVVILSVPTASYSGTTTGSPTITTSGSNTIIKFTGSGTYTG